jgi:NitT/TauT family transport system permease protein
MPVEKAEEVTCVVEEAPSGMPMKYKNLLTQFSVLAGFVIVWKIVSLGAGTLFVPDPIEVVKSFGQLLQFGDLENYTLLNHTVKSLIRILSGFALGCVTGIPLGLVMGLFPRTYVAGKIVIEPVRFIPPIAWIPLSIVMLSGFSRYTFLIWLGAFFPIWVNTMGAVPNVNPVYINVARVYGASRGEIIRKVIWPSVLPDIISGMRVGLGVAWMCIVAAEMIGGEATGVGRLILKYAELLKLPEVVVGMLIIGIIGYIMNEIFLVAERRIFRWRSEITI